ncbi:MAG: hypothetical protein JWO05_1963 [Gemmatimonadetes bacterium]|nr:hypothetical protein [Gemmatimonadota bacterium]
MLDGGAMFGVVPKTLWERRIAPDEKNRIPLSMRTLLIEHDRGLVLIDTGSGNKESEKFESIYGIVNQGAHGDTHLEDGIRALGFSPADVTMVIDTHLHFDHAGGNTRRNDEGITVPSFPNARYVINSGELEYAQRANERTSASYFPHNYMPLMEAGLVDFTQGDREVAPGIELVMAPGHTPNHQGVIVRSGGEVAFFPADLIPTSSHLPLPWIMGYDVEPLVTLESKRRLVARAVDEEWLVVFEHDAVNCWGRLQSDGKAVVLQELGG